MKCKFEAYGIGVEHPAEYRIYINQNQKFRFEEGCVKFDNPEEAEDSRASLTISWEPAENCEGFSENYLRCVEEHYQKKVKNRYRIMEKQIIDLHGHEAAFIHSRLASATHIFKAMGKSIVLEIMQTACYCPQTKRCIFATVMAQSDYFQKHLQELKHMLLNIGCHMDTSETARHGSNQVPSEQYVSA